ncbi:hypothetical protein NGUA34_00484 [Salmonella enterica]|nr:hypothetical protein NGUA34_00484 [Salmonella enterica]
MASPVKTTRRLDTVVLHGGKMILVGQKDKTQAVDRPPEFYLFVPLESFSLHGGQPCLSVV